MLTYKKIPPPPDKNSKPKTALLYICTGNYVLFWDGFLSTAERHFLPTHEKHYFVFTDDKAVQKKYNKHARIHVIAQEKLGWPQDSLMRFHLFDSIKDSLQHFDYIYFCNANTRFGKVIDTDMLPDIRHGKKLLFAAHIGFAKRSEFAYDDNPKSRAYVAAHEGTHYVWGGFNGGVASAYLMMIAALKKCIDEDLAQGIIARWHDESHINRYLIDHKNIAQILPRGYAVPFPIMDDYERLIAMAYARDVQLPKIFFVSKEFIYPDDAHARLRATLSIPPKQRAVLRARIAFLSQKPCARRVRWVDKIARLLPCTPAQSMYKIFNPKYIPLLSDWCAFIIYLREKGKK